MAADTLVSVEPFLRPSLVGQMRSEGPVISSLPDALPSTNPFEGLYGSIYGRVIRTNAFRRAAFGLWGSADPLYDLDAFVADAIAATGRRGEAVVVDLPSGAGTLIPMLERQQFAGTLVEVDLAAAMLARAVRLRDSAPPSYDAHFLRADALDLPLRDAVADLVISINGLHVVQNPERFLSEIARVLKPAGNLWIVTPVDGPGLRSRMILRAARVLSIAPRKPPTRMELRRLFVVAGFDVSRDYGGQSIAGFGLHRGT